MNSKEILEKYSDITITVKFAGDKELQSLNKAHLKRDITTDVLSFEMGEELEDGSYYLGDVVVNAAQATRQAGEYGNSAEEELAALVEHGILHLLGVHHADDDDVSVHGVDASN